MFIDIHCHLMGLNCLPESYFNRFIFQLKPSGFRNLSSLFYKIIPWSNRDVFSKVATLLKIGSGSILDIYQRIIDFYPENSILVPLMLDFQFAKMGRIKTGFHDQLKQMIELKEKKPDKIYPFLAVDPRRDNIRKITKDLVGKNKPFQGIKIYPPLGYLPSHPILMDIFYYCEKKGIPITTHCSISDLPVYRRNINLEGLDYYDNTAIPVYQTSRFRNRVEVFQYLANPIRWIPVLKSFPDLFLNLAHLGGNFEIIKFLKGISGNWTDVIINLASKYPNVYTDISYVIFKKQLFPEFKKLINSFIGHKILFGTDYYIVLWEGHFNSILNNSLIGFSKEEFEKIAVLNNRNFLGIGRE